jgi:organic radical activating enzyme
MPDLVIEATSVCDRACVGCYAPNVVSKKSSMDLLSSNPSLFLFPENLSRTVSELSLIEKLVSVRGGEPTRNPLLPELLAILAKSSPRIYLETHGKWLSSFQEREILLETLRATKSVVKISFDSMHGTSAEELSGMVTTLRDNGIGFSVAITESSHELFLKSVAVIESLKIEEIFFQNKATTQESLVKPTIGALRELDGRIKRKLHGAKTLRFNPFAGTGSGGNQSFATALLDEEGDGVVISTLYSREKMSVFAKPIKHRTSEFDLTDEEKEVLK